MDFDLKTYLGYMRFYYVIILEINIYTSVDIDIYYFNFRYINVALDCNKDIHSKEKEDIVKLLTVSNAMLQNANVLTRDHRAIKKKLILLSRYDQ